MEKEIEAKLANAKSLEEAKEILNGHADIDPERVWEEIERHRSNWNEKLDLNELDAIAGGARDYAKEGCAATVEVGSWCWSNDHCMYWDVTYVNLWSVCPDGKPHEFVNGKCRRCGITEETANSNYYPR